MKLRTLIIDDEPIALEKLRLYVSKVPFLELAGSCNNAIDAINFLSQSEIDLIFTDINMPDLNGMELVSSLTKKPMVVFITAHSQYAVDSYKLSALDYLLKPYDFADFQRAANKAFNMASSQQTRTPGTDSSIFIKVDYRYLRVNFADIRYVKGYGEYLQVFVSGSASPLLTLSSFAAIMQQLPGNFVQIHRSYIVNMNQIERIERGRIILDQDTDIPIGNNFKASLQEHLQSHSIGKG